jgi:hypothetical protein
MVSKPEGNLEEQEVVGPDTEPSEDDEPTPQLLERDAEGDSLARDTEPVQAVPAVPLRDLGLKVVLSWKGTKATIGVSAEGCDAVFRSYEEPGGGTGAIDLDLLLAEAPHVLGDAIQQWAQGKQRPAYQAPPTPPRAAPRAATARAVPAPTAPKPQPEPSMKQMF